MNALRLVPCRDGAEALPIPGGYRLDAEIDWLVEGPPQDVAAVRKALPSGVFEGWGSTLRLRFHGTLVGRLRAGPLGELHVHSGKWDEAEYNIMLGDIAHMALALPFQAGAASALPYSRDPSLRADDVTYHALVWLRHVLLDHPRRPLFGALQEIIAKPHRRLVREEREVPVELASAVSARTLDDVVAGRWPFQRAPEGLGIPGQQEGSRFLPVRIADAGARETADTPENRFVKGFLEACDRLLASLRDRLAGPSGLSDKLRAHIAGHLGDVQEVLTPLRRAALFRGVGRLTQMPLGSTVLQRRAAYREVLRSHLLLRAASRVLPFSDQEIVQMLEIKNIAKLYELWCGFYLRARISDCLGAPVDVKPTTSNAFGAKVAYGRQAHWSNGVELAYNPSYTSTAGWHGKSRSVRLHPDFALFIPTGPARGLHFFDAKFRLDHHGEAESTSKTDDIHKMHTYCDAIAEAKSAWALYPGETHHEYPDAGDPAEHRGVGAFPALPGQVGPALVAHLQALLAPPQSPAVAAAS